MIIKTKDGVEVEMSPEELRHFKINTAEKAAIFVKHFEDKLEMGFQPGPRE